MGDMLTIGELSARSGVAASALRFYDERGLIASQRTLGNQRRFPRATLRRVAVIRAAQSVGLTLSETSAALAGLPDGRTPTRDDWQRLSKDWRLRLDGKITELERLRDELTSCIGCGCLSLRSCALFNPEDAISANGPGARFLEGDDR
ncbi:MAG TPA: redox-sensitive transcriptional activator SoxR [Acidimicrobiia bacterium]|jgi:MerR family redox-sensitive transcriptional activator SoxR